jgi:adenosylhomocysteine nucleosidase
LTPEPGRLGIITALPAEASCLTNYSFPTKKIIMIDETMVIVSGIGAENAATAAQQLINAGATALVSWGTAGGLSGDLQSGDILIPDLVQLCNAENKQYQTDHTWRQQLVKQISPDLKSHDGLLLQTNEVISSTEQKSQLHDKTAAIAVDMESGIIAKIADQNKLPFLIIRSVVDASDETIPLSAINSIDEFGRTKPAALTSSLIKNPGDISGLIKLGKHFQQARKSLKQVSSLAGTSLAIQ